MKERSDRDITALNRQISLYWDSFKKIGWLGILIGLLAVGTLFFMKGECSTLLVLILKVEVAKQRIAEHTQPPADGQKCQRTQEGGCGNLLENPKIAEDQHLNQPTNEGD